MLCSFGDLQTYAAAKRGKTYIVKPPSSCQGRGIWLTRQPQRIRLGEHAVVQTYVAQPFLIDGLKFDLRIYVLGMCTLTLIQGLPPPHPTYLLVQTYPFTTRNCRLPPTTRTRNTYCLQLQLLPSIFYCALAVNACDPLQIYVYKEGLGRFATTPFAHSAGTLVRSTLMTTRAPNALWPRLVYVIFIVL